MRGSLLETSISDSSGSAQSRGLSLVAVLIALLLTSLVLAGYFFLLRRHQQQTLATTRALEPKSPERRGPAQAQIFVDDALLKGDQTILAGTVRNISNENLRSLSVDLELIPRKGGVSQQMSVQVQPAQLAPQEEGRYSLQLRSADYSSAKLVGLKGGADAAVLPYIAAPGQKRPPERLESKTIIVSRPGNSNGSF